MMLIKALRFLEIGINTAFGKRSRNSYMHFKRSPGGDHFIINTEKLDAFRQLVCPKRIGGYPAKGCEQLHH
jgi:hypothetical protein